MATIRVFNGKIIRRKKSRNTKRRARRKNPGGVLSFMANPRRKKHHHRRKNRVVLFGKSKRRSNPFRIIRHHRRRNPAGLGDLKALTVSAAAAIAGGVLTRSIPETLLPSQNTGVMGYALNIAAAFGLGMLGGKFFGEDVGSAIVLGGFVMTAGRVIDDYTPYKGLVEFGKFPGLSGDRKYSLSGDYVNQNFTVPYSSLPGGRAPAPCPSPALLPASTGKAAAVVASLQKRSGAGVAGSFSRTAFN
jgi:hypothetical protein